MQHASAARSPRRTKPRFLAALQAAVLICLTAIACLPTHTAWGTLPYEDYRDGDYPLYSNGSLRSIAGIDYVVPRECLELNLLASGALDELGLMEARLFTYDDVFKVVAFMPLLAAQSLTEDDAYRAASFVSGSPYCPEGLTVQAGTTNGKPSITLRASAAYMATTHSIKSYFSRSDAYYEAEVTFAASAYPLSDESLNQIIPGIAILAEIRPASGTSTPDFMYRLPVLDAPQAIATDSLTLQAPTGSKLLYGDILGAPFSLAYNDATMPGDDILLAAIDLDAWIPDEYTSLPALEELARQISAVVHPRTGGLVQSVEAYTFLGYPTLGIELEIPRTNSNPLYPTGPFYLGIMVVVDGNYATVVALGQDAHDGSFVADTLAGAGVAEWEAMDTGASGVLASWSDEARQGGIDP